MMTAQREITFVYLWLWDIETGDQITVTVDHARLEFEELNVGALICLGGDPGLWQVQRAVRVWSPGVEELNALVG